MKEGKSEKADEKKLNKGRQKIVWSLLSSTWRAPPPAIERTPETFASCILEGKWAAVRGLLTDERTKIAHHHPKFGLDGNEQKMDVEMDSVITNTGGMRGCPGKLYTILDATQVIRTDEHAEGCRVDAHAFYHQLQLNELKKFAQVIRGRYRKFMMSWEAMHPPA
ncbi:hypothetical protein T06_14815 [Trichinella sp. T6]|nr:hypothetical protein T06_14815 [Trichinella sp. T6]